MASLTRLAFGSVQMDSSTKQYQSSFIGEGQLTNLPAKASDYLLSQTSEIENRSEAFGRALPGWWSPNAPAEISALLPGSGVPFATSVQAALKHLASVTPNTASPGLYVFAQTDIPSLSIIKLDLSDQEIFRFASQAGTSGVIDYQELQDVLPSKGDLRKAALIPDPDAGADLRILDDQANEGAASYWLNFLGAVAAQPAPKVLKEVVKATVMSLESTISKQTLDAAVGQALKEVGQSTVAVSPQALVERIRDQTDSPMAPSALWEQVQQRSTIPLPPQVVIRPRTVEHVEKVLVFLVAGERITLRGPASALSGRVTWNATATGVDIIIQADGNPEERLETRKGRQA